MLSAIWQKTKLVHTSIHKLHPSKAQDVRTTWSIILLNIWTTSWNIVVGRRGRGGGQTNEKNDVQNYHRRCLGCVVDHAGSMELESTPKGRCPTSRMTLESDRLRSNRALLIK